MSFALGVKSRRQFVRYGPGAAALAGVVVDAEPADAGAQWAVWGLSVRGGGCPVHGVAIRLLMLSAQAGSQGGVALPLVAPGWGGGSHHVHRWYRW
jgi:hypothetical protein